MTIQGNQQITRLCWVSEVNSRFRETCRLYLLGQKRAKRETSMKPLQANFFLGLSFDPEDEYLWSFTDYTTPYPRKQTFNII
jgi:hypothetical protein